MEWLFCYVGEREEKHITKAVGIDIFLKKKHQMDGQEAYEAITQHDLGRHKSKLWWGT